jgi:predicted hydrocarbon binding protein
MVTFQKKRSVTKKKMTQMVHHVIDFDNQDYETLAVDFKVSVDEAKTLVKILKSCFDSQGNFRKSTFGRIIPDLERYERKIFDFLWHNLKESLHQSDRTAFLDSLQLLVDRLKQPQKSISVLLEDLYQNSSVIRFADRKAFMLGNRLVRSYSQEIVSYQITPEDVLLTDAGIDRKITSYAAWKIDNNQDKFFKKIRTIHHRLLEALDAEEEQKHLIGVQDLMALEREAYIFLALVGGTTSKSVLLSALKDYGHPDSDLYQLNQSPKHMADLLQLLKIVIRGVGRVGNSTEAVLIDHITGRLEVFSQLTTALHEKDLINQIKECADSVKQQLLANT